MIPYVLTDTLLEKLAAVDIPFTHLLLDFITPQDFMANPWILEFAQGIDYQRDLR